MKKQEANSPPRPPADAPQESPPPAQDPFKSTANPLKSTANPPMVVKPVPTPIVTNISIEDKNRKLYAKSNVNVRSGPDPESTKIGTLSAGTQASVIGVVRKDGALTPWQKITFGTGVGFVHGDYLTEVEPNVTITSSAARVLAPSKRAENITVDEKSVDENQKPVEEIKKSPSNPENVVVGANAESQSGIEQYKEVKKFVQSYNYDDDVVAQVLNYTMFGKDAEKGYMTEGSIVGTPPVFMGAVGGWHAIDKTKCQYSLALYSYNLFERVHSLSARTLNLNEMDPKSIKVGQKLLFNQWRTTVFYEGEPLVMAWGSVDKEKVTRGWTAIYSKHCSGKKSAF